MILFISAIIRWRSDGFSFDAISIPLLSIEDPMQQSLDFKWPQEFSYLGRGKQAFAFESFDQKYVIKFFDRHRMELPWYHQLATKKWIHRRKNKQDLYPISYLLAYELMREETDLLFVHMGPSKKRLPLITVIDKASRRFPIDLNQIPFVLQKKASQPFVRQLQLSKNKTEEFRSWIDQYIAINQKRISLFIANRDKHIKDNYRCEKERLVYIDPGRYYLKTKLSDPQILQEEWRRASYELRAWIKKHASTELAYFDQRLEAAQSLTREILCKE
jgi:hypothetical protein